MLNFYFALDCFLATCFEKLCINRWQKRVKLWIMLFLFLPLGLWFITKPVSLLCWEDLGAFSHFKSCQAIQALFIASVFFKVLGLLFFAVLQWLVQCPWELVRKANSWKFRPTEWEDMGVEPSNLVNRWFWCTMNCSAPPSLTSVSTAVAFRTKLPY